MNYLINYFALICSLYVIFLQGVNFFKYRLVNGANRQRIILFVSGVCLMIHVAKRVHGPAMPFLMCASIGAVLLYDGFNFKKHFK